MPFPLNADPVQMATASVRLLGRRGLLSSLERTLLVHSRWTQLDGRNPFVSPWAICDAHNVQVRVSRYQLPNGDRFEFSPTVDTWQIVLSSHSDPRVMSYYLATALAAIALGSNGDMNDPWWGALELLAPPAALTDLSHEMALVLRQPHIPAELATAWWRYCRVDGAYSSGPDSDIRVQY